MTISVAQRNLVVGLIHLLSLFAVALLLIWLPVQTIDQKRQLPCPSGPDAGRLGHKQKVPIKINGPPFFFQIKWRQRLKNSEQKKKRKCHTNE